jgi:hypothetical protein
MEDATVAVSIMFYVMGSLGLFFTGVGALWGATVYKEKMSSIVSSLRELGCLSWKIVGVWDGITI